MWHNYSAYRLTRIMQKVIEVINLVKKYPTGTLAVNDISFDVYKGEIFGLLGENGAGKTTTLEMIEGLRKSSSGEILVLGTQADQEPAAMKEKIGVQLQSSSYYQYLTLEEILTLFGSFYDKKVDSDELLEMVQLKDKAKSFVTALSGGQRQRFSIVASLVNDPEIVFLDEPTTGLDPIARRNLWNIISQIRERGKTVVLTTHYMEEAELLCDRIGIMEKGKLIALDKTSRLVEKAKYPYTITFEPTKNEEKVMVALEKYGSIQKRLNKGHLYEAKLTTGAHLTEVIDLVQTTAPEGLTVRPASLEDIFIELTGKAIQAEEEHAL